MLATGGRGQVVDSQNIDNKDFFHVWHEGLRRSAARPDHPHRGTPPWRPAWHRPSAVTRSLIFHHVPGIGLHPYSAVVSLCHVRGAMSRDDSTPSSLNECGGWRSFGATANQPGAGGRVGRVG